MFAAGGNSSADAAAESQKLSKREKEKEGRWHLLAALLFLTGQETFDLRRFGNFALKLAVEKLPHGSHTFTFRTECSSCAFSPELQPAVLDLVAQGIFIKERADARVIRLWASGKIRIEKEILPKFQTDENFKEALALAAKVFAGVLSPQV